MANSSRAELRSVSGILVPHVADPQACNADDGASILGNLMESDVEVEQGVSRKRGRQSAADVQTERLTGRTHVLDRVDERISGISRTRSREERPVPAVLYAFANV